ncbi:hypothetical protein F53441_9191 [Fusarium austroafricanum]|uniref:Cyclin-like domain-containing protein n=1 Tax=Fusarium austroafricanum TaxID=2364996 RepID=A0A8H4KCX4_9HYPO|nr:hypothetical protein F53441_9191 [Fusarium austroafricanum]
MKVYQQQDIDVEPPRLADDEYLEDTMQHMRQMENETLPDDPFINMQKKISCDMRTKLIDYLIEVHTELCLLPDTLFLAVNLLDRYCSKEVVDVEHYQLIGCVTLRIAAKYWDKQDHIHELNNNMCYKLYNARMFNQMEMNILDTLDWIIGHPTISSFLQLMVAEKNDDWEVGQLAAYLCKATLRHRDSITALR